MVNLDESDMNFIELARFDNNEKQWGMSGGFGFSTDITTTKGGREKRNANYAIPRGSWEIGNRGVTEKEYKNIQDFQIVAFGKLLGFRMRDWTDYKDQGSGVVRRLTDTDLTYQMYKKREISQANVYRLQKIVKPIGPSFTTDPKLGNTIKFYWNGNLITQSDNTADPYTVTLNDKKGQFTFNPSTLLVSVDGVTFTSSTNHNLKINDGIRFTLDNNVIYTYVTEIIDSKRFKTAYSQSFTADSLNMNPYPTDVSDFTWTGMYDKPVRFDTDEIIPTVELFKGDTIALQLPSIQLIELLAEEDYLNSEDL